MKKIEIFAPEDIEFDFSALNLGSYYMPGDVSTEKILKLMALQEKMKKINGQDNIKSYVEKMRNQVCSFFEDNHSQEEIEKLKNKLGFSSLMQVTIGIYETMNDKDDIKNLQNRASRRAEARET